MDDVPYYVSIHGHAYSHKSIIYFDHIHKTYDHQWSSI